MKTALFLRLVLSCLLCVSARAAAPAKPLTIVLISGEFEYKSAETLPLLKTQLENKLGAKCIYLQRKPGTNVHDIPGLEVLEQADLAILFIRRMVLPADQLARFKRYAASGRPIIGLRTASHAFENWKEWDHDVLGGNYHMHHDNKLATTVQSVAAAAAHPILAGLPKEFISPGSLYKNSPLPEGSQVLLTGAVPGQPAEPIAWTHQYGNTPVFYTSLGHPKDFELEPFNRLLLNAVRWALAQPEVTAPPAATAAVVGGPAGYRRVGVAEFEQWWREKKATVLDVRTTGEFQAGHIPGAVNLDALDAGFDQKLAGLNKTQTYLIHCASGRRSANAAQHMKDLGFRSLVELAPGFNGWQAAGKPVEK